MEENGEDVASLAAYISTDGSYTETVPMLNHSTLTASSQGSSSATKSRRQPVWTDEETRAFIHVWGDDEVQSALASNYRTVTEFQSIAEQMRVRGYNRDWEQCRERAKVLRRGFKEIVDGNSNSGHGRRVWPYFEELNRFLCIKQNLVVPRLSGSNPRPPVDRRRREHREAQDALYEQSPVGKSDKGTFEEPDGDCLLLPEPGSQQSEANMENQAASPAANSDISMDGSIGPGTPTDPLPSNDSVTAPNLRPRPLTAAERMRNLRCRQRKRRGDTLKELMEVTSQATSELVRTLSDLTHKEVASFERAYKEDLAARKDEMEQSAEDIGRLVSALESSDQTLKEQLSSQTSVLQGILEVMKDIRGRTSYSPPYPPQYYDFPGPSVIHTSGTPSNGQEMPCSSPSSLPFPSQQSATSNGDVSPRKRMK
ncbi:uncharacterized protein LOC116502982 [Thamnophis elegans]|uniref:uncharacterized protein LOC116502982 n=1 Tax=Thamnophis elegans TaxID=35005 RepID=UPI0013779E05|nr:uncharacterized protein LOC116502982 [Thamnophis elegans]XP_032064951.1 uncharacterized protein LOC116502982 [Thamnophis elegans]